MNAAAQLMAGKKGLVMGVANERSIAWGIAKACHEQGAQVAFTFQGEALEKRVRPLANSIGANLKIESQPGQGTMVELAWGGTRRDQ